MVVGNAHALTHIHTACALASFVLTGSAQETVNPASQAASAVQCIDPHGVANLDFLREVVAFRPVGIQ